LRYSPKVAGARLRTGALSLMRRVLCQLTKLPSQEAGTKPPSGDGASPCRLAEAEVRLPLRVDDRDRDD
jgi:hypothetical protein